MVFPGVFRGKNQFNRIALQDTVTKDGTVLYPFPACLEPVPDHQLTIGIATSFGDLRDSLLLPPITGQQQGEGYDQEGFHGYLRSFEPRVVRCAHEKFL
jgi:hypothetical protein